MWKRYCDTVGTPMGHGLAALRHHELASIADEKVATLSDRLKAREAELEARARELKEREKELNQPRRGARREHTAHNARRAQ